MGETTKVSEDFEYSNVLWGWDNRDKRKNERISSVPTMWAMNELLT
jgi:hypothetical protein